MASSFRAATAGAILTLICAGCTPQAPQQGPADLAVEALSIYTPMPGANGDRPITTSFRVVNHGAFPAPASIAFVKVGARGTIVGTPALTKASTLGSTAYLSATITTAETAFSVTAQADVLNQVQETTKDNNTASYDFGSGGAPVNHWRALGPSKITTGSSQIRGVGRITAIAADPFSPDTVYAGARGTGLWNSFDGGVHWQPLTDALPTANIQAIAVDPSNPARILIVTPSGVFGSLDAGSSWRQRVDQNLQAVAIDGGAFFIHPQDPQRVYLTTMAGLRISQNGGTTWDPAVLSPNGIVQSLSPSLTSPNSLLATVVNSPNAGVWEADDGGLTAGSWRKLQGCPEGPIPAIPATGASAWVTQSGVTEWLGIKSGNAHELWRTSSRACVVNGRFERVWERQSSGEQVPCITSDVNARSNWSFLFADPTDKQIVYKAGIHLCRSTDGGAHFQAVGAANVHVDNHALVFHPTATGVLYLGTDGGFYRSDDRGQSWTFKSEGLAVSEFLDIGVFGAAPRRVTGAAQDNILSFTDESTPIWREIDLGSDLDGDRTMSVVDPQNADAQYSAGQALDHFSKIVGGHRDGGFDQSNMPPNCLTYDETPTLNAEIIATTSPQFHLITTAGVGDSCSGRGLWTGPPWHQLFEPPAGERLMRVLHDPGTGLFVAGNDAGSIYLNFSPDAMAKVFTSPKAGSVVSIIRDPPKTSGFFVAFRTGANEEGRIFEITPEAPLRFKGVDITANLPKGVVVMTLAFNPFEPDALYAGTRGAGIFRGVHDAAGAWTWQAFNNGLPQGAIVTKLKVDTAHGAIYASTWGRGAFAMSTVSIF
jgi:photosystem II stability/assembly factor-like uncharacterized protein